MEQKTVEEIYLDNGCNSKRDIIEAMQSYADKQVDKAVEKALEMASSEVEFIVCATTYERIGKDLILSLKPEILKELEK